MFSKSIRNQPISKLVLAAIQMKGRHRRKEKAAPGKTSRGLAPIPPLRVIQRWR